MIKKNIASILAAAVLAVGLSAPASRAFAQDPALPVIDTLFQFSGAQAAAIPAAPAPAAVTFDQAADARGNNGCKPSAFLVPGKGFSPRIDDKVRVDAMNALLAKIAACKPLPYEHDGITNTNSEGGMPHAASNFYKEYTLIVPGRQTGDDAEPVVIGGKTYMTGKMLSTRGPERLIIGGGKEIYYTMDHYKTFIHLTIEK